MSTYDTSRCFLQKAMAQAALRALPNSCGQRARKTFAARALKVIRSSDVIDRDENVLSYLRYAGLALTSAQAALKAKEYIQWELDMSVDGQGRFYPKQTRPVVESIIKQGEYHDNR
jgi:hypothetical protein